MIKWPVLPEGLSFVKGTNAKLKVLNPGKPTTSCLFPPVWPEVGKGKAEKQALRRHFYTATTLRFKVPVIADGGQLQSDDMRLYDPDHLQLNLSMYSAL